MVKHLIRLKGTTMTLAKLAASYYETEVVNPAREGRHDVTVVRFDGSRAVINALCYGQFAVHRQLNVRNGEWVVTHLYTGLPTGSGFRLRADAVRLAKLLDRLNFSDIGLRNGRPCPRLPGGLDVLSTTAPLLRRVKIDKDWAPLTGYVETHGRRAKAS